MRTCVCVYVCVCAHQEFSTANTEARHWTRPSANFIHLAPSQPQSSLMLSLHPNLVLPLIIFSKYFLFPIMYAQPIPSHLHVQAITAHYTSPSEQYQLIYILHLTQLSFLHNILNSPLTPSFEGLNIILNSLFLPSIHVLPSRPLFTDIQSDKTELNCFRTYTSLVYNSMRSYCKINNMFHKNRAAK